MKLSPLWLVVLSVSLSLPAHAANNSDPIGSWFQKMFSNTQPKAKPAEAKKSEEKKPESKPAVKSEEKKTEAPKPAAKPEEKKAEVAKPAAKLEAKKPEVKAEAAKPAPKSEEKKVEAKKPEEKKAEATKPAAKPEEKKAEAKPEEKKAEAKPEVKAEAKTEEKKPEEKKTTAKNDSIKRKFELQSCAHKVRGGYANYGQAPYGCDANMYESADDILKDQSDLVFNEKKAKSTEVKRYTTAMYRYIRDTADAYISKRNRDVSTKEKEAFRRAIMALVHQESFWSHYRLHDKDGRVKVMKGDEDWSFGMMQVHGRWHGDMVRKTKAWTISGNLGYGLDIYYNAWLKAKGFACNKSLEDRARGAYSIYNAGGYAGCRWQDEDDKWARNDKGFYEKWRGQMWNKWLDKKTAELPSTIDVACLLDEGGASCANSTSDGSAVL